MIKINKPRKTGRKHAINICIICMAVWQVVVSISSSYSDNLFYAFFHKKCFIAGQA